MSKVEKKKLFQERWMGPFHISKERLEAFAAGHMDLEETELSHATVCEKCSNQIAGIALTEVEEKGDHPRVRRLWDKFFHK